MQNRFTRTELLIGKEGIAKLSKAHIAVFGVGGVGSFAAEALARSGIGEFSLYDNDTVCITNINRQLIATTKTIGQPKVQIMKERITDINPAATVHIYESFISAENIDEIDFTVFDYIVDAIDTVSAKLLLVQRADEHSVPIMSSMGAGNKLDPTKFEIADIYDTSVCPLAKIMRKELRQRNIDKLKVVYSKEQAIKPLQNYDAEPQIADTHSNEDTQRITKRQTPGSIAFVPSVAGLIIAGEVIKDIIK